MKKISVLFVDDEINILNGLKRKLYSKMKDWDIAFMEGGQAAIDFIKTNHVDVLVTDMRMPGISGLELIRYVYEYFPDIVRIILSGHAEKTIILQSIGLVHQYFSKPANTDDIVESIYQIIYVRDILKQPEILKVITQIRSIPCLPSIYHKIMDLLKNDDVSMKNLGDLIIQDIGLSAKILQLINSSFFSVGKKITDVHQALNLLGLETLRDLILTIQIFDQVDQKVFKHFHLRELWKHSVSTAHIAKWLAKELGLSNEDSEAAFIAGLLHDSGKLILANEFPSLYEDILLCVKHEKISFDMAEQKVFNVNHSQIISYLTSIWGFSNEIVHALLFHHYPEATQSKKIFILTCLYLANYIDLYITYYYTDENKEFVNLTEPIIDKEFLKKNGLENKLKEWIELVHNNKIRG